MGHPVLAGQVRPAAGRGTVVAAGSIFQGDLLEENRLISSFPSKERNKEFYPGLYLNIKKRVINNIIYSANLIALRHWYKDIRSQFFQSSSEVGRQIRWPGF